MRQLLVLLLVFGGLLAAPGAAHAGSYEDCTGFIDSLPTTISTQGTWCLRGNLSTNIASGKAISIITNNVTIDCHGFKVGGLQAGNGSSTLGIHAANRQNITIRHCNIRGFRSGIYLYGGAGHVVEDNRLDNSLYQGMWVSGDNNLVRRNRIFDTGGAAGQSGAQGMYAQADIIDNTVRGLFADQPGGSLFGIISAETDAQVRGNSVSGFDMTAMQGGAVINREGIRVAGKRVRLSGNQVAGDGVANGVGINAFGSSTTMYCLENTVSGFGTNLDGCTASSSNLVIP